MSGLMPTSARRLREIARERAYGTRAAEEALEWRIQRQGEAEETARLAEQGIAPPGWYLTDRVPASSGRPGQEQETGK